MAPKRACVTGLTLWVGLVACRSVPQPAATLLVAGAPAPATSNTEAPPTDGACKGSMAGVFDASVASVERSLSMPGAAHDGAPIHALRSVLECTAPAMTEMDLRALRKRMASIERLLAGSRAQDTNGVSKRTADLIDLAQRWAVRLAASEVEREARVAAAVREYQLFLLPHGEDPEGYWARAKACKPSARGVCVYRRRVRRKGPAASRRPPGPEYPVSDYTEEEKALLASIERLRQLGPPPQLQPRLRLLRGVLAYEHNRFTEARRELETLVERYSDTEEAATAMSVMANLLSMAAFQVVEPNEAAFADVLEAYRTYPHREAWRLPGAVHARESLPTMVAGALWQRGLLAMQRGKDDPSGAGFAKCAEDFLAIHEAFDEYSRADTLLWNAAHCLDGDLQTFRAQSVRRKLLREYPNSEHAPDTRFDLATSLHATAHYARAADEYRTFALNYRKDRRTSDALRNAHLLYRAVGNETRAAQAARDTVEHDWRKDPQQAARAHWHSRPADGNALRLHALEQLRRFGKVWTPGRLAAMQVLAQREWARSCPGDVDDGLCVRKGAGAKHECDPVGPRFRRVQTRRKDPRAKALNSAKKILRLAERASGGDRTDARITREAAAAARAMVLAAEVEAILALPQRYKAVDVRVSSFVAEHLPHGVRHEPSYAVQAAGWTAVVQRFALRWELTAANTCPSEERLQEMAEPIRASLQTCVQRASFAGVFPAAAQRCVEQLEAMDASAPEVLREVVPGVGVGSGPSPEAVTLVRRWEFPEPEGPTYRQRR